MWRSLLCLSSCLDKPKLNQNTNQISKKIAQLCQYIDALLEAATISQGILKSRRKGTCRRRLGGIIFPKTPEKREQWVRNVSKGPEGFQVSHQKTVCTNHFNNGKPTSASPASTFFLILSNNSKYSPRKKIFPHASKPRKK